MPEPAPSDCTATATLLFVNIVELEAKVSYHLQCSFTPILQVPPVLGSSLIN